MSNDQHPQTKPPQSYLLNTGMFIQFHLAAIGHVVIWLYLFFHPFEGEGAVVSDVFVGLILPASFLVTVHGHCASTVEKRTKMEKFTCE